MNQISVKDDKGEKPKVSIFLSHKGEDVDVAKVIKGRIEALSAGKIQFHLSEELPKGDDWYAWIERNLESANWFMLLFTDPSNNWDWCLYEAGLFRGIGNKEKDRLICLHDKCVEVPNQLKRFQNVCAEEEDMLEFLKQIFVKPIGDEIGLINPALEKNGILNDILKETAKKICEAIKGKVQPPKPKVNDSYFQKYLILRGKLDDDKIENAKIYSNSNFNDIFRINIMPRFWGEFKGLIKEIIEEEDKQSKNIGLGWVGEIEDSIDKALQGKDFDQPKEVIEGLKDQKLYRPILTQMASTVQVKDLYRDFHLIFVDHYGGNDNS